MNTEEINFTTEETFEFGCVIGELLNNLDDLPVIKPRVTLEKSAVMKEIDNILKEIM